MPPSIILTPIKKIPSVALSEDALSTVAPDITTASRAESLMCSVYYNTDILLSIYFWCQ